MQFSWNCIFREGVVGREKRESHVLSKLYLHTHYACTQHTLVQRWLNMFCVGSLLLCFLKVGIANRFVLHSKPIPVQWLFEVVCWEGFKGHVWVHPTVFILCLLCPMHNAGCYILLLPGWEVHFPKSSTIGASWSGASQQPSVWGPGSWNRFRERIVTKSIVTQHEWWQCVCHVFVISGEKP